MSNIFVEFVVLLLLTWIISQTIKYLIKKYLSQWKHSHKKIAVDTYVFYSGPPSTHTALLTSATLFFAYNFGVNSGYFLLIVLLDTLWIYEIVMQRKRIEELSKVINHSEQTPNSWLRIKEFNGHSVSDILYGILTGFFCYLVISYFSLAFI